MEPEGVLPHSEVPATCPYPKPAQSSPHPHIPLPKYYHPICAWVSQVVYFNATTNINLDNTELRVMSRTATILRPNSHTVCGYSSVNSLLKQVIGPGFILNFPSAEHSRRSLFHVTSWLSEQSLSTADGLLADIKASPYFPYKGLGGT